MITYKTPEDIERLREGGKILADIMRAAKKFAVPGTSIEMVDKFFGDEIKKAGCVPAFLNYTPYGAKRPFPSNICICVNDEIVHGIPTENPHVLKEGDIVTFDAGLIYMKKYYLDHAWTYPVGEISKDAKKLLRATEEALYAGIKNAKAGKQIGDISHAIEARADKDGMYVVEGLAGHGVGYGIHEDPYVPNEGDPRTGEHIKEGLVIAIEPMFAIGTHKIRLESDGYTFSTKDGSLSAQFEHTVAVTEKGPIILTK
jgi:methionyl aminopeptidase